MDKVAGHEFQVRHSPLFYILQVYPDYFLCIALFANYPCAVGSSILCKAAGQDAGLQGFKAGLKRIGAWLVYFPFHVYL